MIYRPERELVAQAIAAGIPAEEAEATIVKLHTAYRRTLAAGKSIRIPEVGRLTPRTVKPPKGRYFGAKPVLCSQYGQASLVTPAVVWTGQPAEARS